MLIPNRIPFKIGPPYQYSYTNGGSYPQKQAKCPAAKETGFRSSWIMVTNKKIITLFMTPIKQKRALMGLRTRITPVAKPKAAAARPI
jgi:hypothetical protein